MCILKFPDIDGIFGAPGSGCSFPIGGGAITHAATDTW